MPGDCLDISTKRDKRSEIVRFDSSLAASERVLDFLYGEKNWGLPSWNTSLLIALCYPSLFLIFVWAFSNRAQFGSLELLPPINNVLLRLLLTSIAVLLPIAMGSVLFYSERLACRIGSTFNWQERGKQIFDYAITFGTFAFSLVFLLVSAFLGLGAISIAFTIALAIVLFFLHEYENHHGTKKNIDSDFTVFVAGSIAVLIALAVTFSIAYAVGSDSLFLTIVVLVFFFSWLVVSAFHKIRHKNVVSQLQSIVLVFLLYCGLLALFGSAPLWPWTALHVQVAAERWQVSSLSFILFFFFGLIPVVNAIFDFISVGLTRNFIARYRKGNWNWWFFLAVDVSCAVLLTIVLYAAMVSILDLMEFWGWGIEAAEIRNLLKWETQNSWISLMAATNIIPTLTHLYFVVRDLLLELVERSKHKQGNAEALGTSPCIEFKATAQGFCNLTCTIDRVMGGITVFLFFAMLYPLVQFVFWTTTNSFF